ncbi:MAG: hypothetical protein U9N49_05050 [Campylobacterota bacterium]|nr:hypothetical protein [Campylobacterota bacterium]
MKQTNIGWSIKTLFLILSITIGLTSATFAEEKKLAMVIKVKGDVEAKYNEFIEKTIKTIGFVATDPHKRVNDAYKKKYGSTNLDILSFMSIVNKNEVKKLLNIDPRLAGFNPFNLLIHKKLNEDTTYISHLMPEAILDMIGITDQKVRTDYIKSFEALDKLLLETFGKDVSYKTYTKLPPKTMMNFVYKFDRPEDLDDFVDEFQEQFEEKFEENKYIIAGFFNYKEFFDGEVDLIPGFDAYWTYALCHFKYSYTVFDNEGGRPDAGIFAPCSMYMFIKKGSNELHIGMPTLANWAMTLDITGDKTRYEFMQKLDKDISAMLVGMGAKVVENSNPLVATPAPVAKPKKEEAAPKAKKEEAKADDNAPVIKIKIPKVPTPTLAPKVITEGGNPPVVENESPYESRKIKTPKSAPPSTEDSGAALTIDKTSKVGEVKNSRVSAYLQGPLVDIESVKSKLTGAGFTILSEFVIDKKGKITSIVFTNPELIAQGNKEDRGFAASCRILIDKVNNQLSITNPLYISRAFMQKDYDNKVAMSVLKKIRGLFAGLKDSKDILKYHLLPKYHFMIGMPYYEDMIEVAKDSTAKLIAKAKKNKNVVYVQKLSEDRYVVGFKLSKRTAKFVKKIGYHNAALLPYPVLIEDGAAKLIAPKYYIALMYPMLKMSQFMTISTIPGAIQKESINLFK